MIRALPALLLLMACEPPICGGLAPSSALTQGHDPSIDLVDGDHITMVHGPQGGWHLSLGVRVVDPSPSVSLDIEVDAPDGPVVTNHYDLVLQEHDGCTGSRRDLYGFIDVSDLPGAGTPPERLSGEPLQASLVVEGSMGTSEHRVELIARPDPQDVP